MNLNTERPPFLKKTFGRSIKKEVCTAEPKEGYALETEFQIKCDEDLIEEEDIPLLFNWYFRVKSNETWKIITYPSDGIHAYFFYKKLKIR